MILPRKKVTEDDVKATEARISASFNGLKRTLSNFPAEAARPVADTVRAHPYASMATSAGAGFLAYRILDLLLPRTRIVTHEVSVRPRLEVEEKHVHRRSLASRIVSEAATLATPYITAYVQKEVAEFLSKPGKEHISENESDVLEAGDN